VPDRIAPLDPAAAGERAQALGLPASLSDLSVFRVALHSPNVAGALHGLLRHLLFEGSFDARLRELVIMRIGWSTRSVYEWTQHWRVASLLGVEAADVLAVRAWDRAEHLSPEDRAILAATDDVLATGAIGEDSWVACAAFLDSARLVELVAVIGCWRLFSTFLVSLAVPLEDGVEPWPPDGVAPDALPSTRSEAGR
jgi:alkylhydroperoxidase family enzyme